MLAQQIKEKMDDLILLTNDRKKAVGALNNLNAVPEMRKHTCRERSQDKRRRRRTR